MHCLALISAVDPLLVDLTALALHGQDALVLIASLHAGGEEDFIRLTAAQVPINGEDGIDRGAQAPPTLHVARTSECWTCSLREVLVAIAEDRARLEPDGATVVLLPPGIELIHLAPRLAEDLDDVPGAALAGLAHVIDVDTAARDLLTHQELPDSVVAGEGQCAGEVHMVKVVKTDESRWKKDKRKINNTADVHFFVHPLCYTTCKGGGNASCMQVQVKSCSV